LIDDCSQGSICDRPCNKVMAIKLLSAQGNKQGITTDITAISCNI